MDEVVDERVDKVDVEVLADVELVDEVRDIVEETDVATCNRTKTNISMCVYVYVGVCVCGVC